MARDCSQFNNARASDPGGPIITPSNSSSLPSSASSTSPPSGSSAPSPCNRRASAAYRARNCASVSSSGGEPTPSPISSLSLSTSLSRSKSSASSSSSSESSLASSVSSSSAFRLPAPSSPPDARRSRSPRTARRAPSIADARALASVTASAPAPAAPSARKLEDARTISSDAERSSLLVTSVRAAALDQSAATLGARDPGAGPTPLANAPDAASTNGLATGRSGNANPRRRSVAAVWILRATPADASPPTFAASAINARACTPVRIPALEPGRRLSR